MIWEWIATPRLIFWVFYAITFATGGIVHAWRIYALRGRATLHMWLEMMGLFMWSIGAMLGGAQLSYLAAYGGTSPLVRLCWITGSALLMGAGVCYLGAAWRNGRK